MNDKRKLKLIKLGADTLADTLLELAGRSDIANDLIEHLIATPKENVQRFKTKIANLEHLSHFIDWEGSSEFELELEMLLEDLKAGVTDPLIGIELVAAFYETDSSIFEMCDDSSGCIGTIFLEDAKNLFLEYASRCADKMKVADLVLKVSRENEYGVRDALIDCAGEYLPESTIRTMIVELQGWVDKEKDEYKKRHYLILIETLARQIKDAKLFEQTRIASRGKLSPVGFIDIASVYLESGDVEAAHMWLKKIPKEEDLRGYNYKRDELLLEIYRLQGDREKLAELL